MCQCSPLCLVAVWFCLCYNLNPFLSFLSIYHSVYCTHLSVSFSLSLHRSPCLYLSLSLLDSPQVPKSGLPAVVRWVGCQGSKAHLRRYPCGVWTLFHVLTVQAQRSNESGSHPQSL